tara:strand:+ start:437 stop:868 length:432 start_codon:yes stop_codon:yes gene_type:complete
MNIDKTARTVKTILCDECGVVFSRHQCHISKTNFCSRECQGIWRGKHCSGINHPSCAIVGMIRIKADANGRKRAWIKVAYPDIWRQRARWVWETQVLQSEIPDGKIIHHIDGDTLNDCPDNLKCVTRKWHVNHHRKELVAGKC